MSYLFPPPPVVSSAVIGETDRFAVRRIFCVGRNYAAHTREMGGDPTRDAPFFFLKPADALIESGETIAYPSDTDNLHYEIELVVAIGLGGRDIAEDQALDHVFAYGVGVDLTRRDRQLEARDKGRPWDLGKAFDQSAPMAPLHRAADVGHLSAGRIWLAVNGEIKQEADLSHLIWSVPEIIAIISKSWELRTGDLIFSGTPDKVGPIGRGDRVTGGVAGLTDVAVTIAA